MSQPRRRNLVNALKDPEWPLKGRLPDNPEGHRLLAASLREQADLHEAIAAAQEFDELPPPQPGMFEHPEFLRTIWGLFAWPGRAVPFDGD